MLGHDRTGDGSVREVEEFRFHPNQIRALETGEGIVSIPHFKGVKVVKLRFKKREDIAPLRLPRVLKEPIADLSNKYPKKSKTSSGQGRVATGDLKTTEGKKNETNA
ncbi:MAG: hypothetical protein HY074_09020 [Deltaproteobacteria bacterium]|nr:hypothetical protein [Deltaproteobacteria bacterium]